MIVKDLIKKLQEFDKNLPVYILEDFAYWDNVTNVQICEKPLGTAYDDELEEENEIILPRGITIK